MRTKAAQSLVDHQQMGSESWSSGHSVHSRQAGDTVILSGRQHQRPSLISADWRRVAVTGRGSPASSAASALGVEDVHELGWKVRRSPQVAEPAKRIRSVRARSQLRLLRPDRRRLGMLRQELEYLHTNFLEFRIGTATLNDTVTRVRQRYCSS
jgi:hypothetical protein